MKICIQTGDVVDELGFEEGYDSYGYIEANITTAKKVIYNAYVAEPLSDSLITVGSFYTYQHAKEMVSCINFFQLDFELSNLSSTYIEAN